MDKLDDKRAVTFRPTAQKFHDAVAVTMTVNAAGRLLDAELRLDRGLIDGTARVAAADIAKAFLRATTATDDAPYVTFLVNDAHRFAISAVTFVMALLVAQTRIEAGVHSSLEVFYGAVLGAVTTLVCFQVFA